MVHGCSHALSLPAVLRMATHACMCATWPAYCRLLHAGILPWLGFGLLCALDLWLCACLPFCLPGCSVREHQCPRCHRVLAAGN